MSLGVAKVAQPIDEVLVCLHACTFFESFPESVLRGIAAHSELIKYGPRAVLLQEGEVNQHLYFLIQGAVGVYDGGELVVTLNQPGDAIGEMSFMNEKPCNATIVTIGNVRLLKISAREFLNENSSASNEFSKNLYRVYSEVLSEKLEITNGRAKKFEETNLALNKTQEQLEKINQELEQMVEVRTSDLRKKTQELESQNTELVASHAKLEELYSTRDVTFDKLEALYRENLEPLRITLNQLNQIEDHQIKQIVQKSDRELQRVMEKLEPLTSVHRTEKSMRNKCVLLAESNKREQVIAKLALGGSGVNLDIVSDLESGVTKLREKKYDIFCGTSEMISLFEEALKTNPDIKLVFLTSEDVQTSLADIQKYPFLTNVVFRNQTDRGFTVKTLLTTITKLVNMEVFGMDKYLIWGTEIQERAVTGSNVRNDLIQEMDNHLGKIGLRRRLIEKANHVAEELLMNAIYDAPVDSNGKELFNHLPRTQEVNLMPEQYGKLSYGCDGVLLAISVEDPFGSFKRQTILDYLESCYSGKAGSLNAEKGGAGRGLHNMVEVADLVVFNVKEGSRTEGIALFHIDSKSAKQEKKSGFQFFTVPRRK